MRWRVTRFLAVLLVLLPARAGAQQAPISQLSVGIGAGVITGSDLWTVSAQPLQDVSGTDTLRLNRRVRSSLSVVVHATWFPGLHWGFTGEMMLMGLGTADACHLAYATGNDRGPAVCTSISGESSGQGAAFGVGGEYRPWVHHAIQPYLRAHLALAFTQHSTLALAGIDNSGGQSVTVPIYVDASGYRAAPVLGLGFGFTAPLGAGYQLRWEVRDQLTSLRVVTGATLKDGLAPPSSRSLHHLVSMTFGFDVVLAGRRSRRY